MSEHKALIESFYTAFQHRNAQAMAECYHPEARFEDAAFSLEGEAIGAMWEMLCERGEDMVLTYSVTEKDGDITAHWEPVYTFSQTGRKVHNVIDAKFEFKDGKIYRHVDSFDFWRWSKQALGMPGWLLGWSSFLQNKVRAMAAQSLDRFMAKRA